MKKIFFVIVLCCIVAGTNVAAEEIVVIAHPSNPVDELTLDQLRNIYLGDSKYFPGTDIKTAPIDHAKGSMERKIFYQLIIKMSPKRLKKYWSKKVFSGEASPPRTLPQTGSVLQKVANSPSSIAYVYKTQINEEVKTLKLRIK